MRSQGLPSSFLPAHLGINYSPPSPRAVLCDGFMPAAISRRSRRSARHLVNLRSSCSMCEAERSSPSVSAIPIHLEHFSRWLIGQPVTTVRKPAQSVPLADGIERLRYGFHQGLLRASLDAA